jgi:hypothetical protein
MAYNVLAGSGIKSITRSGFQTITIGVADGGTGTNTDPYYKDITISAVDSLQKTLIFLDGVQGGGAIGDGVMGILTTTTNIRLYYTGDTSYHYEIVQYY